MDKYWWLIPLITSIIAIILIVLGSFKENNYNNTQWGGYCPMALYKVFDKDTGAYYVVTEKGGICPMYTIEGEVKLVDQGNEYVVHRNLGDPNVSKVE